MIKLKKLTVLIVSVLILLSSIGVTSAYAADAASESDLNEQLSENEKDIAEQMQKYGISAFEDADAYSWDEQSDTLLNNEYPENFDLRNVDTDGDGIGDTNYVTPVKLQNPWGTCWAFAAIAASEISILYELGIGADEYQLDLSELQISWFGSSHLSEDNEVYPSQTGEGRYSLVNEPMSLGGAIHLATNLFSSGIGPTFEENVPYRGKNGNIKTDTDGTQEYYSADDDWSVDEKYRFTQIFELEESNMLPSPAEFVECEVDGENISQYRYNETATYAIKNELMEGRAVAVSFCADQYLPSKLDAEAKYINTDTWAHYTYDENATVTHGVTIVGWDDTYSKENFLSGHQPPEDGAWIVKNSWGAENNEFPDKKTGE